jgi:hypothetical protein
MKTYKNYFRNMKLRRENRNIRKIKDGKAVSFWTEEKKVND